MSKRKQGNPTRQRKVQNPLTNETTIILAGEKQKSKSKSMQTGACSTTIKIRTSKQQRKTRTICTDVQACTQAGREINHGWDTLGVNREDRKGIKQNQDTKASQLQNKTGNRRTHIPNPDNNEELKSKLSLIPLFKLPDSCHGSAAGPHAVQEAALFTAATSSAIHLL